MTTLSLRGIRLGAVILASACSFASALNAAPIFNITSSTISVTRLVTSGGITSDVRGLALVDVSDPGALGTAVITDLTGGNDPGFVTLPFGNNLLVGLDLSFAQIAAITFDLTNASAPPNALRVSASGIPFNTITDPALTRFLGTVTFDFSLVSSVPGTTPGDSVDTYSLTSITSAVPEPASMSLVFLGISGVVLAKRLKGNRRRSN